MSHAERMHPPSAAASGVGYAGRPSTCVVYSARRCLWFAGVALFAMGIVGCGQVRPPDGPGEVAPPTVTVTVNPPTSGPPLPTTPPPTPSTAGSQSPSPTGPSVITVSPGSERVLQLSDAYGVGRYGSNWTEGSVRIPSSATEVQGMATKVGCYSEPRALEFRFAQSQGAFSAAVAQSLDSTDSSAVLEWTLVVDGRRVSTQRIAFKETAEFSTSLAGVAVVRLEVLTAKPCSDEATGVVTSAKVDG